MQFCSNRAVSISININGQRIMVMFDGQNSSGVCSFVTMNQDTAMAIRRHSFFKKGIIWEDVQKDAQSLVVNEEKKAQPVADCPRSDVSERQEMGAKERQVMGVKVVPDEKDVESKGTSYVFANFTEAKEWFCKTYGVGKTTVRNPAALQNAAKEKGIEIKHG